MPGAVEAIIEREVSGRFSVRERSVTVTTTRTQLLTANPERVGWLFTNLGAVTIFFRFVTDVTSANGIPVGANGGNVSADVREDFVLPTFAAFAVSGLGSSIVDVIEIVRESEGP